MRILNAGGTAYIGSVLVPKLLDRGNIESLKLLSANNGLGSLAEVEAR
jgi:UDP-glucose 4-epimerase